MHLFIELGSCSMILLARVMALASMLLFMRSGVHSVSVMDSSVSFDSLFDLTALFKTFFNDLLQFFDLSCIRKKMDIYVCMNECVRVYNSYKCYGHQVSNFFFVESISKGKVFDYFNFLAFEICVTVFFVTLYLMYVCIGECSHMYVCMRFTFCEKVVPYLRFVYPLSHNHRCQPLESNRLFSYKAACDVC